MGVSVIFFAIVYSVCSGTALLYGDKRETKRGLPSLYAKDYGSIEYVAKLTLHGDKVAGTEYVDEIMDEKAQLTRFWAQEAVFAPEAREMLQDMELQGFRFNPSEIGVVDSDFFQEGMQKTSIDAAVLSNCPCWASGGGIGSHGTEVSNLITGESPIGVSSKGKITMLGDSKDFFSSHHKISNLPPVINASISLGVLTSDSDAVKGANKLLDNGIVAPPRPLSTHIKSPNKLFTKTIFVFSVGNSFPKQAEAAIKEFGEKMIVMGSLDPSGFVSKFSQSHQHVVVLAPSDNFITTRRGADGTFKKFGGTSGAAPLVSGAIADLRSILPDLTRDEVAIIIAKTATRTSINIVSNLNGAGTLNQYKMLRVGQRLSENGWPHNRENLIADEKMYDFADEAKKLTDAAETLLQTTNEADYKAGFKKLRTAFALDANNTRTRTMLADLYKDAGYSVQAMFYDIPERSVRHAGMGLKIFYRIDELIRHRFHKDVYEELLSWEKLAKIEKMYINAVHFYLDHRKSFDNKLVSDIPKIMSDHDFYPNLATLENDYSSQQDLLLYIDILSSYGFEKEGQAQLLNLLIEYVRDTHPELMAETAIQKAIAKRNLNEVSRLKHRIYNFVDFVTQVNRLMKYTRDTHPELMAETAIAKHNLNEFRMLKHRIYGFLEFATKNEMDKETVTSELQQELRNVLQEVDRQPELLNNDPIIAKYAQTNGMNVADIWKTLRNNSGLARYALKKGVSAANIWKTLRKVAKRAP